MPFITRRQYQNKTDPLQPIAAPATEASWHKGWSQPVRKLSFATVLAATSGLFAPVYTPTPAVAIELSASQVNVNIRYETKTQYKAYTAPVYVPVAESVTVDKWTYPWSEPLRKKRGLRVSLQKSFFFPEGLVVPLPAVATVDISRGVTFKRRLIYQSQASPPFTPQVFEDSWHQRWSTPVRFRRFQTAGQSSTALPVFVPEVVTYDKWGFAWSEPVRFRRFPAAEQQAQVQGPPQTPEFVTVDKWIYPWSEPVRQKIGLKAGLQQAAIGPVLEPETQISQNYESRWHYAWSEPVRIKRQVPAGEQQFQIQGPPQTPEFITVDKWIYGWSEPVRQKIGLKTHLQQAYIAPVLNPETQIIQDFESRWHFPWSEPVRVKRPLLTAQQQALIFQSAFFETINIDKWGFAWSEPVRQKIGLKTYLQQAFIGLTLEPETQIIQDYESRWHFPWSEPVRIKRQVPAGQQQFLIQGPAQTPEFITVDKWVYPWTDPVRQKIGMAARLQQAFIAPVLTDDQITNTYESRWHQPWSEPLRSRRFPAAEQQSYTAPATSVFEVVTLDKWTYPWSEPVRQKPGLKTQLQQAFIGLTLNPETQIIQGFESRWHQPWSEPLRSKPGLKVANQPLPFWSTFTPAAVVVLESQWHQAWSEPLRQKPGLRSFLQRAFFTPDELPPRDVVGAISDISRGVTFTRRFIYQSQVLALQPPPVFEGHWHQPWSEPVRFRRFPTAEQQAQIQGAVAPIEPITIDKWLYQLSEPVRQKIGLRASLQQTLASPPQYPILVRVIPWFAPLNEPVRLKIGLGTYLQREFTTDPFPIPNAFSFWLDATEVNSDSALFGFTVYTAVPVVAGIPTVVVSIKEIPAVRAADASVEELPAIDSAAVSIEET